jgi:hypothetical protein
MLPFTGVIRDGVVQLVLTHQRVRTWKEWSEHAKSSSESASGSLQRCKSCEIVKVRISGGRSLTTPFRDARRFPSTRL